MLLMKYLVINVCPLFTAKEFFSSLIHEPQIDGINVFSLIFEDKKISSV